MPDFSVVILAGGRSARMGSDKALLPIGSRTMIEEILAQLAGVGAEHIIIANAPERYAFLGLPTYPDILPGKGALGGLYTAVHAASQPHAMVLACDMPFVNRPLLAHMASLAPDFDAVVPRVHPPLAPGAASAEPSGERAGAGEAEPFRAVYSKACLGPMRRALDEGRMRVISFFPEVRLRWVDEDEIRQFDPDLLTFMNCNTPEELEAVKQIWARQGGKR